MPITLIALLLLQGPGCGCQPQPPPGPPNLPNTVVILPPAVPFTASISGAVLTIGGCSTALPCNARISSLVFSWISSMSITLAANASGTVWIYIDSTGVLSVGGTATATCTLPCQSLPNVTGFPPMSIPLWSWTAINGAWVAGGGSNYSAQLGIDVVSCGAGLTCVNTPQGLLISVMQSASATVPTPATIAKTAAPAPHASLLKRIAHWVAQ